MLDHTGFSVVEFDGAGLFLRILKGAELIIGRLGPLRSIVRRAIVWDARHFQSANLFCIARKRTACARDSK
jgi:hypothetical protein